MGGWGRRGIAGRRSVYRLPSQQVSSPYAPRPPSPAPPTLLPHLLNKTSAPRSPLYSNITAAACALAPPPPYSCTMLCTCWVWVGQDEVGGQKQEELYWNWWWWGVSHPPTPPTDTLDVCLQEVVCAPTQYKFV